MTPERKTELEAAYRTTLYRVVLRSEEVAPLDADSWAFLTACNPMSEPATDAENAARLANLRRDLAGFDIRQGEGASPDGTWREPSFLVLGISEEAARSLAAKHGQAAFLYGERGQPARLVWIL